MIDAFDFNTDVPWKRIAGGTSELIKKMLAYIKVKPETKKRVTKISIDRSRVSGQNMQVEVAGENVARTYSTVFSTASLACMQRMDLRGLELHPSQKDALRSLRYDASCKVAIRFQSPWWVTKCGITGGGSASTDLPVRTVVYPSNNPEATKSAVLMVSYTWSQDAQRVGSLISRDGQGVDDELKELILQNLVRLHAPFVDYTYVKSQVLELHAYDWYSDPNTSGAFALFGPGQFENLYPYLTRPTADGNFHFVGEAASAHHAWIAGSLDSAALAVHAFLKKYQLEPRYQDTAQSYLDLLDKRWGRPEELDGSEEGTEHLQVALGMARPKDHVQIHY